MAKIIDILTLNTTTEAIKKRGRIVLVGGCFDILHVGHIKFLKEAKKNGDLLMVLLESDATATKIKGKNRPYFSQKDRAEVLSSIKYVDYVILMAPLNDDCDYDKLVLSIKPYAIAVTENDPHLIQKENQAKMVGGKIRIMPHVVTLSSSQIAELLGID